MDGTGSPLLPRLRPLNFWLDATPSGQAQNWVPASRGDASTKDYVASYSGPVSGPNKRGRQRFSNHRGGEDWADVCASVVVVAWLRVDVDSDPERLRCAWLEPYVEAVASRFRVQVRRGFSGAPQHDDTYIADRAGERARTLVRHPQRGLAVRRIIDEVE